MVAPGFRMETFILYRLLSILVPFATCFPSLVMKIIPPPPPVYRPPASSHLPRDIRLFQLLGIYRTFSSLNRYLSFLYIDSSSIVPRPSMIALLLPTPATVLPVTGL